MKRTLAAKRRTRMWTISIILLAILLVFGGYFKAQAPRRVAYHKTVSLAEKYANLKKVTSFYHYNRKQTFYMVSGTNNKKEKVYVIVYHNGKKIIIYNQTDGINAAQAKNIVKKHVTVKRFLNIGMGMQKKTPVWEISYLNQNGNLCYDTIAFKSGQVLKSIQNI